MYPVLADFSARSSARVEHALDRWLPTEDMPPVELHRAMRYATLAGGKYVRPLLVYAAGEIFGADPAALDGPACAVEMIHAYSLIHDDLPAMDDDALRRGKPSCHIAFGEAMAILAGDALQALAFHLLAADPAITADPALRLRMIDTLAVASSSLGMAGGQAIDLAAVGHRLALEDLEDMHLRKTGALISASVSLGALAAGAGDNDALRHLHAYARCVGLAFQIRDDILDIEGETAVIGKTSGSDVLACKPTYCSLLGVDGARARARSLHEEAVAHLEPFGADARLLREIAGYIVTRIR
ncbi:MAG: polyprenyl synthetase family protein [Gammaproteobacteria bacterium]|jgi:farnesyl diphosphate synthase|nr:polyprenyl synthetase family protein [Gammaproteobacteria bacterium]